MKTLLVLLGLWVTQVHAAESIRHPLWMSAQQAMSATANTVAGTVTTRMEVFDGAGKSLGTMQTTERIVRWEKGEPVREIVANNNPEYASVAKGRIPVIVENHPERALPDDAVLEKMSQAVLGEKSCTVFFVSGANGGRGYRGEVWIEEATGLPLQVVQSYNPTLMVKSATRSITFGRSPDGDWLPLGAAVDLTVSQFFQQLRFVSKYRFADWIVRGQP